MRELKRRSGEKLSTVEDEATKTKKLKVTNKCNSNWINERSAQSSCNVSYAGHCFYALDKRPFDDGLLGKWSLF